MHCNHTRKLLVRLGPVQVHAPDDASSTFDTFKGLVPGRKPLRVDAMRHESRRELAARDVERLAQFMAQPEKHGLRLLLMGFVDTDEASPYLAQSLSNDRVDHIADQLLAAGLPALRARGLSGAAPLASDSGEAGRHRNRRVEVWLESGASEQGAFESGAR